MLDMSPRHAHQKSRNRIFFGPARHRRATLHAAIAPHASARHGVGRRRGLEKRSRRRPRRLPKWQQERLLDNATELKCSHPILDLILDLQPNQSVALVPVLMLVLNKSGILAWPKQAAWHPRLET